MALQTSGAISFNDIHVEAGGTSGTTCALTDTDIRALIGKGLPPSTSYSVSEWYGASAATTILSGNATHTPAGQYVPAEYFIGALSPHKIFAIYNQPLATNVPVFTLNGRNTYCAKVNYTNSAQLQLFLVDISGGVVNVGNGYPANSGWNTMTLSGNGNTVNLSRSAATYSNIQQNMYINGSSSLTLYSTSLWVWSNQTNPFPASHNTTPFTVTIR